MLLKKESIVSHAMMYLPDPTTELQPHLVFKPADYYGHLQAAEVHRFKKILNIVGAITEATLTGTILTGGGTAIGLILIDAILGTLNKIPTSMNQSLYLMEFWGVVHTAMLGSLLGLKISIEKQLSKNHE